ncbi:unnamed protein product [Candidula unifasciata]|uniref:Transporter n=1 Tax=Candidula unifasciata TaxID=100452 RepID=A0A8S3ZIY5_9EUPU|nr:unnamed protein product [Candidula unifasciata]
MAVEEERGKWGRQLEFVLTLIGFAVGLGNVWRFPYLCFKNGGGAFLIPYTLSLIFLGIPIFAMECAFGQYGGKGPLSIWTINPAFKGLGISMIVGGAIVIAYYSIVIAWGLRFLVASFTSELPWLTCRDCSCLLYGVKNATQEMVELLKTNNSLGIHCPNISPNQTTSPSELYFVKEILADTGSMENIGGIQWEILLCNLFSFVITFLVLVKGVESLGKVSYFSAVFPYVLLTILLVRCALLDGAYDGVLFYLTPDWSRLKTAEVWSDAAVQIFFSLSACSGGLVAMSSYNNFNNNIIRDAFVVPIVNCLTSFYAGFVIFSTLGYMAKTKGVPIADVTKGGPGLAFIVYPEALGNMPVSSLWAILFFFMLCLLGFSSLFSSAETLMTAIIDEFPHFFRGRKRKILFRLSLCALEFLLGIPMITQGGSHLLDLVDSAMIGFPLLFIGLFEYIVIIYIYGYRQFAADVKAMVGFSPFIYFKATWTVISPLLLLAIVIFKAYEQKDEPPAWKSLLYYLILLFVVMWIPVYFFYYSCKNGLWEIMKPQKEWTDRRKLAEKEIQMENDYEMFLVSKDGFCNFEMTVHRKRHSEKTQAIEENIENSLDRETHLTGSDNCAFTNEEDGENKHVNNGAASHGHREDVVSKF